MFQRKLIAEDPHLVLKADLWQTSWTDRPLMKTPFSARSDGSRKIIRQSTMKNNLTGKGREKCVVLMKPSECMRFLACSSRSPFARLELQCDTTKVLFLKCCPQKVLSRKCYPQSPIPKVLTLKPYPERLRTHRPRILKVLPLRVSRVTQVTFHIHFRDTNEQSR